MIMAFIFFNLPSCKLHY